jgi:hypothetical protein
MDKRVSGRKGLSNALRHETKFFLNFEQLMRIDNLDGSFDKNFLFIQPAPDVSDIPSFHSSSFLNMPSGVNTDRIKADPFFQGP